MNIKEQISNVAQLCDKVAAGISKRNSNFLAYPECRNYCPGEQALVDAIQTLLPALDKYEPEISARLKAELKTLMMPQGSCVNAYSFGAVTALLAVLNLKYRSTDKISKIFISHSSKDKDVVEEFVDEILQLGIGMKSSDVFCTSIEDMKIRNGEDMRNHIQHNLNRCDYAFIFISENYKNSGICMNEMGAVWAYDKKVKLFTISPITFTELGWLMEIRQAADITDVSALDELYDDMTDYYSLQKNASTWGRHKQKFLKMFDTRDK